MDWWPIGNDAEYLVGEGIISRPDYPIYFDPAKELPRTYVQAFQDREAQNPGCWSIAQGSDSLNLITPSEIQDGRDLLVRLHKAVPIPAGDVPLAEVLEFKERRLPELSRFRHEIESLYEEVANNSDKELAFNRRVEQIQKACADLIKVNKEWKFGSLLSDWDFSISLRDLAALGTGVVAAHSYGLNEVASLFAGAFTSSISFAPSIGKKIAENKKNPYRYTALAHKELRF